eukprot:SAG31_NODE_2666_length_5273_cov_2.404716_7_plen_112_part_00
MDGFGDVIPGHSLQHQIRRNAQKQQDLFRDIFDWEEDMVKKDEKIRTGGAKKPAAAAAAAAVVAPPVRGSQGLGTAKSPPAPVNESQFIPIHPNEIPITPNYSQLLPIDPN